MRYSTFFLIALSCIIFYYDHQTYGFSTHSGLKDHLLYHFCHANVFHLAANLLALYAFRPRIYTCIVAYTCAVLVSYIPIIIYDTPTMGLSAFLFAAYSRKFYFHHLNPSRLILLQLAFAFIPGINWMIHIAAFISGYLYWMVYDTYKTLKFYHLL